MTVCILKCAMLQQMVSDMGHCSCSGTFMIFYSVGVIICSRSVVLYFLLYMLQWIL